MKKLRGLKALLHDVAETTLNLVEEGHSSVARNAMRVLTRIPQVADAAREIESARHVATSGVFDAGRWLNRTIEQLSDDGIDLLATPDSAADPAATVPLHSDITDTAAWRIDGALGVINGVVGDHLSERKNGLDLGMQLRSGDQMVGFEPATLAAHPSGPARRVALLIHGLSATEWSWCIQAEEYHADPAVYLGSVLASELGAQVLLLRYNSGRHISHNGRLLAEHLERLFAGAMDQLEVILIGHSMGGLLARSACHYGSELGHHWPSRVKSVFCLGSPHQGAPLEKLGGAVESLLTTIDTPATRILGRLLGGRSAGIKDLRHGSLRDEDWVDEDWTAPSSRSVSAVPLLAGVRYHFLSATVTRDANHPLGQLVGDILVRVPSASGPTERHATFAIGGESFGGESFGGESFGGESFGGKSFGGKTFGGIMHHQLQNHPDVIRAIVDACREGERTSSSAG